MNIPELFGDNPIAGSMVSGFVGLVVDEPIIAHALCAPDNSPNVGKCHGIIQIALIAPTWPDAAAFIVPEPSLYIHVSSSVNTTRAPTRKNLEIPRA
jgi:hypothetical protein